MQRFNYTGLSLFFNEMTTLLLDERAKRVDCPCVNNLFCHDSQLAYYDYFATLQAIR